MATREQVKAVNRTLAGRDLRDEDRRQLRRALPPSLYTQLLQWWRQRHQDDDESVIVGSESAEE